MLSSEIQKEIERLQGELQNAESSLVEVKEKLEGRRSSLDWEQKSGQEEWKKELEEKILWLETEIAKLQATETQTESKLEEKVEELSKWLEFSPNNLNKNKEEIVNFLFWIVKEKSKDLENFADPKWVKENIEKGEIDLNKLKQEFQEWKVEEEAKREREREREREKERETSEIEVENGKFVDEKIVANPQEGEKLNEVEISGKEKVKETSEFSKEEFLAVINSVFNEKLNKGEYHGNKESWGMKVNRKSGEFEVVSLESLINECFTKNSEEFKNLKEELEKKTEDLKKFGILEERREEAFTQFLGARYKEFAEAENFTPTKEEAWTWFGFDGEKTNPVFLEKSIQAIKNPARRDRLTGLLSEVKENLKQLGEKYQYIKSEIQRLHDWLVENASIEYNDNREYWKILDKTSYLPADELIDKEIAKDTELNRKLKDFLAESQRKWKVEITQGEQLSEINRVKSSKEPIISDPNISPYKLDSSDSGSSVGDADSYPQRGRYSPVSFTDSETETPPTSKGNWGWEIKTLIGVVVVVGLVALVTLVVRTIKNQKKGEKTKK